MIKKLSRVLIALPLNFLSNLHGFIVFYGSMWHFLSLNNKWYSIITEHFWPQIVKKKLIKLQTLKSSIINGLGLYAIKRFILQFLILFKPNHLFMIQWHSIEVLENIPRIFCEKFFPFPNMQFVNIIFVNNLIYNFHFSVSFWRNWDCYKGGNIFSSKFLSQRWWSQSLLFETVIWPSGWLQGRYSAIFMQCNWQPKVHLTLCKF